MFKILALDHIVIPTSDPQHAAEMFSKKKDLHITKGGSHPNWGTYNYLAYFKNDVYIEWIGIEHMHIAKQSTNPLIQQVVHALENAIERPVQYALRANNMIRYIEHFKNKDIAYSGPYEGSRGRPDGTVLEWKMLFPTCTTSYALPFLIEWGKQPNVPADENLINNRTISSFTDKRPNIHTFNHVFQLPEQQSVIPLENCTLSLQKGDDLTFLLGE